MDTLSKSQQLTTLRVAADHPKSLGETSAMKTHAHNLTVDWSAGATGRVALLISVLLLPSCGTMLTRVDPAYHYPGKSVIEDLRLMFKRGTGATSYGLRYWEMQDARIHAPAFLLSLPIDLALDTLLLPLDVGIGLYRMRSDGGVATAQQDAAADGASRRR